MEIVVLIVVAVVVIAGAIYFHYQQQKRIAALRELASRRGWRFSAGHDSTLATRYGVFSCLDQGSNRYAYNVLNGPCGDYEFCGFDYHYETYSTDSKGKRTTHHHYLSVVVIETDLPLKPLFIRTETFFDKVGEFFGMDDIDFESHEFSRQFCVKADDRRWAFDVIHQATMEFLLAAPRFTIQFAGRRVMAYRGGTFTPEQFEQAEQVITGILDRLPNYLHREWKGVRP